MRDLRGVYGGVLGVPARDCFGFAVKLLRRQPVFSTESFRWEITLDYMTLFFSRADYMTFLFYTIFADVAKPLRFTNYNLL